jgi:hypothetical protein
MEIPVTDFLALFERYNGMAPLKVAGEAPVAPDPLNSEDPLIREAAEALAAQAACASRAA